MYSPDLTQRPPRSPRVRLGGYAILPRLLDKCRAVLEGRAGEYKFNCPLDQLFLEFAGIEAEALKQTVAKGLGDGAVLEWIAANSTTKPSDAVIAAWSSFQDQRAPASVEKREFFQTVHAQIAPKREDILSWFDLLDIDDYVSFGGIA